MKRLRIIVIVLFLLSAVFMEATSLMRVVQEDKSIPVISVPKELLMLSIAQDSKEVLMQGVTAWDAKDGDLTEHIYLQSISRLKGNQMEAVYAVCDSDDHVTTASRVFQYYDFAPPRFRLTAPLCYNVGSSIVVKDRLFAEDVMDGDLSDQIRVYTNGLTPYSEGVYPVTFEVTNSFGDTSSITLDIQVKTATAATPAIHLSEYLVYTYVGDTFDPMEYLMSVDNGRNSDVTVKMPEDGLSEGLNQVVFSCVGENGMEGTTVLYVMAE